MYKMSWRVVIGKYALNTIETIKIKRSVEALSDSAVITLPATVFNRALEIEEKVKRGDAVSIQLGYNDRLCDEFSGFVESIETDGGSLKISCEDGLFLFRKEVADKEMPQASVKQILESVCSQVGGFSVSCDYDFTYDKFVINHATGYDILKKIQEEAKPNIYLKEKVLHVHPQYMEIFGSIRYDFAKNIDKNGISLKYKKAEDKKLLVVVEGKTKDGKTVKVEEGTSGGDKKTMKIQGVTSQESLRKMAKEMLEQRVYTGYEGSFKSWLVPFCDAGYKATIYDEEYEYKNGTYYVTGVDVDFSKDGGVRTIYLGKKIS